MSPIFQITFATSVCLWFAGSLLAEDSIDSPPDFARLARYESFALTHPGDAEAGRRIFENEETQCITCHRVGNRGGQVGPDLSRIGGKYARPHLIDALLHPSRQINYGYETTTILLTDGRIKSGIIKQQDEQKLTLIDAKNQSTIVQRGEIEELSVSKVSLMPVGLTTSMSSQQFTDLVTYLESLGSGNGRGGGIKGAIQLADGFTISTVATGLTGATAFEIAPDGRIFICEQSGNLRVVKDGRLLEEPFLSVPVEMNWERGLIGVTVSPQFPEDPSVYIVYVTDKPYTHHRISRFRASGGTAVPDSEEILLKGDDQSKFGGNVPAGHQGGAIHFGPDGKLYIGLGEQTSASLPQRLDVLQGKVLRINKSGSIPDDNPFIAETEGKYQSIWAIGCRNPFTFAFSKSGDMLINDVGGKFEEINRGHPGANFGWSIVDHGPTDLDEITGPIHVYPQSSINGGDFCADDSSWPQPFRGKYFFADFVQGWVKWIDPQDATKSHEFVSGIRQPVDLRFSHEGDLYVLLRNAWVADDKFQPNTGSLIRISLGESNDEE